VGTATNVLKSEHRGIEKMLGAVAKAAPSLRAGDASSLPLFEQAIDFFRGFADACHHYKEEKILFPALVAKGFSTQQGPVAVMLAEHVQGRAAIRAMADAVAAYKAGNARALADLATAAETYVELLTAHIQKEDNVLFVMADRALSEAEQSKAAEEFERAEAEVVGPGVHERYHKLLDTL
jgi:hemerythrin-like domain-containing protein